VPVISVVNSTNKPPAGYRFVPLNTTRSSRLIYGYTDAHESTVARDALAAWKRIAADLITDDVAQYAVTSRQLPIATVDALGTMIDEWVKEKLAPQWEGAMALGATVMIRAIEKYIGRSLGTAPKSANLDAIYKASDGVLIGKKTLYVPPELKTMWDDYYAGTFNPGFHTDFPEVSRSLTEWIKTRGAEEAIRYKKSQLETWKKIIQRGVVEQGINGEALGIQLREATGLTEKMEIAVERHRAALIVEGVGQDAAQRSATKYALTLRKRRALAIGRTELANAYNGSRHLTVVGHVDNGVIRESLVKRFFSAVDERVCPTCGGLHDKVVGLKEVWITKNETTGKEEETGEFPPVHVKCRCVALYEVVSRQQVAA